MNAREVGAYIRDQRLKARLSLHGVSSLAGVSIPYLSQIERGLRRPSADILYAIAKALRISAGTLYVRAGILEDSTAPDVAAAIMADPTLTERHKQALVQIYQAFREEAARDGVVDAPEATPEPRKPQASRRAASPRRRSTAPKASSAPPSKARRTSAAPRAARARTAGTAGGGAKSQAGNSPHPAPLRSSAINPRKEV